MPVKVLVVDDEKDLESLINQKFRKRIKAGELEFYFALNGRLALEKLESPGFDVDIILSDLNMPEIDGLTLLEKTKELYPVIKTVIVTAYGDMENIRVAMNRGAFDFITKPIDFTDLETTIQKTYEYVQKLKSGLSSIRENNVLKMYVDDNVIRAIVSEELTRSLYKSETIEATVAFIDICGFTELSEREAPEQVINLLGVYFDMMVLHINLENGVVDKFIGDAVMAVFRGEDHLKRTVSSCLNIKRAIKNFKVSLQDELNFFPEVSIGINSGEMVSGNIGAHSLNRLDYTVIGDAVNTASRLQRIAKESQILITGKNLKSLNGEFLYQELGNHKIKGKSEELKIYNISGVDASRS